MKCSQTEEVFRVAKRKDLTETGGGHNQKGVDFQRTWALTRMFELEIKGNSDFLFLFEAIQDVAELDSLVSPSSIRIYQAKKRDRGEWTWKNLTNLTNPNHKKSLTQVLSNIKDSPFGKLYSAVLAFKELKSSGRFISNAGCDLPLQGGGNTATSLPCDLSQLEVEHFQLLTKGLDTLHNGHYLPSKPSLIHVEKIPIHPDSPATYLLGIAVSFLMDRSPKHVRQASAFIDALLAKIGPLGARTDSYSTFDELRKERGFSRIEFISALGTLEQVPDEEFIIESWLSTLLAEGGINFMELAEIHLGVAKIFQLQLMAVEDPHVMIACDIDKWLIINTPSPDATLKDFVEKAKSALAESCSYLHSTEFITHLFLRMAKKCTDQTNAWTKFKKTSPKP